VEEYGNPGGLVGDNMVPWSKQGKTGGLLHRNNEYSALSGLYTTHFPPPPQIRA